MVITHELSHSGKQSKTISKQHVENHAIIDDMMSTLDYHTTGIDDEHMETLEHDDGKPPLRKQQSMLLITVIIDGHGLIVIIDGLIAIITLITEIICCAHMIISMIHADATMTSVMRDFLIPFIVVQIGNWINMIMDRTCPMK